MVALGGQPGEREVVPDQLLDQVGVGSVEPDRLDRLAGDRRAACSVVDTGAGQLADVVEEAGQQQEVGPIDPGQVTLRLGHGLHQCRSTVCRWTGLCCGRARIGSQDGIQRLMQPARSRASQTGSSLGPVDSISSSASRACLGPRRRQRGCLLAEVVGGHRGEHQPALRGQRAGPQANERIAGAGPPDRGRPRRSG